MKAGASGVAAVLLLLLGMGIARAQPVYRCGDTYGHTPCDGGRAVRADDARSATARAESQEVTRRSEASATTLQRDREDAEARARMRPALVAAKPAAAPADKAPGKKPRKTASRKKPGQVDAEFFTPADASGPTVRKKAVKPKKD